MYLFKPEMVSFSRFILDLLFYNGTVKRKRPHSGLGEKNLNLIMINYADHVKVNVFNKPVSRNWGANPSTSLPLSIT